MVRMVIGLVWLLSLLSLSEVKAVVPAGTVLKGLVKDSLTDEPLEFVNIFVNSSDGGCITNEKGRFIFKPTKNVSTIKVTCLGYTPRIIPVDRTNANNLTIRLSPSDFELDEVIVKPKKEKYSKKNNPAVEFLNRLKNASKSGDPKKEPFYSFDRQEKMVLGMSDYNKQIPGESEKESKNAFINDYVDSVYRQDMTVLKLIMQELHATDLYTNNPSSHKNYISAVRSTGLTTGLPTENITIFLNDLIRNVDIYDPTITLIQNKFVSPLSPIAADYYKFYLDTLRNKTGDYYQLTFLPHNPESMSFQGRLLIPVNDSTMTISHIEMRVPHEINLNYVRDLFIEQDFELDSLGNRHKTREFLSADFHIIPGTQALYAGKEVIYDNFSYNRRDDLDKIYKSPGENHSDFHADSKELQYWDENRKIALTDSEKKLDTLTDQMRTNTWFLVFERIIKWLADGYISTSKKKSKFDIGNVISFIAYNTAEGLRLKFGGFTTAALSPHWFGRGYVAYGFKDRVWKYDAEVEYSFNPKKRHSREFPMSAIRLEHKYDLFQMGQQYEGNHSNLILSLTRKKNYKVTYQRLTSLTYIKEWTNNLSLEISANHEIQKATRYLPFVLENGNSLSQYGQAYFSAKIRFSPGETFIQGGTNRTHVNLDAPIFWIKHQFGPKGLLGSRYNLNITSLSARYRFWFSSFGYADVVLTGTKCWNAVDFPSLPWPAANLSYTIAENSYSLMNPMEFAVDQSASWDLSYCGNGILFNRIPLIKKLKLREIIGFKGLFGSLTKKNNPSYNKSLFPFPADAETGMLDPGTPYMELSAGIDNILRLFRVDWVYRLTYRDRPGIDRWGIRFGLHFSF